LTTLAGFEPLSPAERSLLKSLESGQFDRLGDGSLPAPDAADRTIRATLLRFLLVGGPDAPRPHEKGIRVSGALITGTLDLEGCRIPRDIGLVDCRFTAAPIMRSAIVDTVFFDGSTLPGLVADLLEARGSIFLRSAAVSGSVVMPGARLGGELVCDGAALTQRDGLALDLERLEARGGVRLRGTTARGGIRLGGARLGGDLDAVGATLERPDALALDADGLIADGDVVLRLARVTGHARFIGARIDGDLDCSGADLRRPGGAVLTLDRAVIEGAFFLRQQAAVDGTLSLVGASLGAVVDAPDSWPGPGDLLLNRCNYAALLDCPVDAATRLDWLGRQEPTRWGDDFWPQPYEQLARVLAEMGHDTDAREVLIQKERLQRRARRARSSSGAVRAILALNDLLLGITVRYGHQSLLAFAWLGLFWLAGAGLLATLAAQDALRPNVPIVLRSPEWALCSTPTTKRLYLPSLDVTRPGLAAPGQSQLDCYLAQPEGQSYPKFNFWIYSLDALTPGLETGQQDYWAPDTRSTWGRIGRAYLYVHVLVGWALSLLAIAGFSGLVRSR
jgi:hypothetical protein